VTAIDTVNAKAIFDSIISSCLGIHEVLKYTIADVKPEKKADKGYHGEQGAESGSSKTGSKSSWRNYHGQSECFFIR